jgi:hypothetical protein
MTVTFMTGRIAIVMPAAAALRALVSVPVRA